MLTNKQISPLCIVFCCFGNCNYLINVGTNWVPILYCKDSPSWIEPRKCHIERNRKNIWKTSAGLKETNNKQAINQPFRVWFYYHAPVDNYYMEKSSITSSIDVFFRWLVCTEKYIQWRVCDVQSEKKIYIYKGAHSNLIFCLSLNPTQYYITTILQHDDDRNTNNSVYSLKNYINIIQYWFAAAGTKEYYAYRGYIMLCSLANVLVPVYINVIRPRPVSVVVVILLYTDGKNEREWKIQNVG